MRGQESDVGVSERPAFCASPLGRWCSRQLFWSCILFCGFCGHTLLDKVWAYVLFRIKVSVIELLMIELLNDGTFNDVTFNDRPFNDGT